MAARTLEACCFFDPREFGQIIVRQRSFPDSQPHTPASQRKKRERDQQTDSYIKPRRALSECNFPTPIKVPPGDWYMIGDNRGESDDSRFWGPVPESWLVGIVRWCGAIAVRCPE